MTRRILIILALSSVTACSSMYPSDYNPEVHAAACRKLKSDILLNGTTVIDRNREIDRAQLPLMLRTYEVNCT